MMFLVFLETNCLNSLSIHVLKLSLQSLAAQWYHHKKFSEELFRVFSDEKEKDMIENHLKSVSRSLELLLEMQNFILSDWRMADSLVWMSDIPVKSRGGWKKININILQIRIDSQFWSRLQIGWTFFWPLLWLYYLLFYLHNPSPIPNTVAQSWQVIG